MPAVLRGGAELERRLAEIARKATSAARLRVGFLESATYPETGMPVATIAAFNEFGVPTHNQPPRPFFRRMIAKHKAEWPDAIADVLRATGGDAKKALEIAGEAIAGQLRQSIIDLVDPPLAPATIRAKGFDKPLISSATMLGSIGKEVE